MDDPRLTSERNVWMATVRPNGRPHLIPVWFVWLHDKFYLCIGKESVKGRNLQANPYIALSLQDGDHPLVAEGSVSLLEPPFTEEIAQAFQQKYDWDMRHGTQYNVVVEVTPQKWLHW